MHIEIIGDDSIGHQARVYAEYRLFAALSQTLDTREVKRASLVLRRTTKGRHAGGVVCTVTIDMRNGEVTRLSGAGAHPYAAINRVVERFRSDRDVAPREGHYTLAGGFQSETSVC